MATTPIVEPLRIHDAIALPRTDAPVTAEAHRSDAYTVHVVSGMRELLERLAGLVDGAAVAVITDETVHQLYGAALVRGLRAAGVDPLVRSVPAGESSKSLAQAIALWDWLAGSDLARRDVVVAFGGGVIADLGGWVASCYMRGIPYVNVPTTLLAQVDGALGGKVAVNHPLAKNLLGAFHQPLGVVADVRACCGRRRTATCMPAWPRRSRRRSSRHRSTWPSSRAAPTRCWPATTTRCAGSSSALPRSRPSSSRATPMRPTCAAR